MQLGSEAEALARLIGGVALALNLLGAGLLWLAARGLRRRPGDSETPRDPRAVVHGRRELNRAERFVDALPWALAAKLPWSGIHRPRPDSLELDNRLFSSPAVFLKQGAPMFDRAVVRWRAARAGGLEVVYSLDHGRLADRSRRMAWILALFITLPNLAFRAPLDFYIRLVQPEWSGYAQLAHLAHLLWPFLIWIIYKASVTTSRKRLEAAIAAAGGGG